MSGLVVLASFVAFVFADILVTSWLATLIGWMGVLVVIAVTFLVGMIVMRRAGTAAFAALREAARRVPALTASDPVSIGDASLMFLGGMLLVLPGVLADLAGLLLVFGPTRVVVRGLVAVWVLRWSGISRVTATNPVPTDQVRPGSGEVIQGEVVDRSDDPP